ncbi:uncharacterized protein si:ch211-142k18.1 [Phyllopteryx taeniolatus]|uniref:uncharacterized protein si:ch211-142k18.1 n=1 Tax=Phyllopteryx taeniolatus TaxID=161469 RepID=UPI002AD3BD5D|nr:uncharacterized protein si:ch211-142k18.1 [Phyllopteryx taeniolatus]XP_061608997.1 uncharacterized protein si:ch211-142k18.1 [Phyllopteryx taeniolatus]XP_061608998.1 uncharacterized protein si:ch211-142k18.1 [Phyllopteryx taeniolatus]XP_061608999.1 uncharacterized protein si:ch211-142k18.1 [Phyllopteryx taeniolatus]XP_061609000.1 uncharacterized protein si:ch211-142k18.1 [Phyllopteryx taeniolatus]XP_061609001.1 uncharacterized protein si:ch211-142k18.1 [Phyllopteryx taeniolatus]
MRRWWTGFLVASVSMATPTICQGGDGDYGSGFDIHSSVTAAEEPAKATTEPASVSPSLAPEETCSVRFGTRPVSARVPKAREEEVAYLRAVQRANEAVTENLAQYVAAELGDRSYEEAIAADPAGVPEEHRSCRRVLEKAEEDLDKRLRGGVLETLAGMHKIREESAAFDDMLRAAADIAGRLESRSQALHASCAKQLRDAVKIHG